MNETVQDETFTKVPNELLEMLARARLSGREHQLVLALIRKTCGFHKKADKISLSQFSKATGISRSHCQEILSSLNDRRIVYSTVPNGGNRAVRMYRINCRTHEWQMFPKTGTGKKNRAIPENGNRLFPKTGTDVPENGNRTCSQGREQQKKEKKLFKEKLKKESSGVALGPFEGDQAPPTAAPQEGKQTYEEWLAKATGKEALNEEAKARLDDVVKRSMEFVKKL